ncbi:uncharacterized protein LOC110990125 [Acanthaster planci]|uniref:Uncharacterized protein LOC110990125 n=1 Tax=Acanthaster planci TaxID=133434 RepID=A0A8B8A107_ACAPL|nr:uncharacterized protein LOC110990125 [Acanthaster planci]
MPVLVDGHPTQCLLDTGSQVTCVTETFHTRNLPHRQLHPLSQLTVIGAAGHPVPYKGYVEISLKFPVDSTGSEQEVTTLALVCPDRQGSNDTPLIVGTNTSVVRRLLRACEQKGGRNVLNKLSVNSAWQRIYKDCAASSSAVLSPVRLMRAISIKPGGRVQVTGMVNNRRGAKREVLIEQSSSSQLPDAITISNSLVLLPARRKAKMKVTLSNVSCHTVVVPARCELASASEIAGELPFTSDGSPPMSTDNLASIESQFDFTDSPLPEAEAKRIKRLLCVRSDVFSRDDLDIGCTSSVKHKIRLTDETPFRENCRRIPPADYADTRQHLRDLQSKGIIRDTESQFASPIVLVRKKNGDLRLCIDYRKLNSRTVKDQYNIPKIEDILHAMNGAAWFSCLDLKSGYYQIELAEEDKHKTAFWCPLGFYEFNRMPQGITNAPATFQRLMERCMGDLLNNEVFVYLDDIVVFSQTKEEHEARLMRVLDRLQQFGLKLSPPKYSNPLTYVMTTAKLDATGHRWLAALANYNFVIKYRPGRHNSDADGLSRRPQPSPQEDYESEETEEKVFKLYDRLNYSGDDGICS